VSVKLGEVQFVPISKIVTYYETNPGSLTEILKRQYIDELSQDITTDIIEEGILSDLFDEESCETYVVTDYINDRVLELSINFTDSEIEEISENCDYDYIIQSNIESARNEDSYYENYLEQQYYNESGTDAIDDLFERD